MFKLQIKNIINDFNQLKPTNLSDIVQKRLDKSFQLYLSELNSASNYLIYKDTLKVLKKINKG